jgi:hypothetical protein
MTFNGKIDVHGSHQKNKTIQEGSASHRGLIGLRSPNLFLRFSGLEVVVWAYQIRAVPYELKAY